MMAANCFATSRIPSTESALSIACLNSGMGFSGVILGFLGLLPRRAPTSRPESGLISLRLRFRDWTLGGTRSGQHHPKWDIHSWYLTFLHIRSSDKLIQFSLGLCDKCFRRLRVSCQYIIRRRHRLCRMYCSPPYSLI